uniref:ankyrin repeat, PH and SEC7 domain containing protein secG-like isoform X2 n=1 Tax=Pristiophorus japonicus TaxID=55135 RepID=UPI00398F4BB0
MSDHGSASKGTKDETKSRSSARTQPVHYENTRRFQSNPVVPGVQPTTFSGLEWTSISDDEFDLDLEKFTEAEDSVYLLNEALIKHFIFVSRSKRPNAMVNLELIEKLLLKGAKVSTADKHGQTVLHEVARNWHVDIASFLIERGAKVDHADNYGRTPLHVAAALNYVEMIALLLQNNANIEARTFDELQTPFHFAAKYDAINALQYLHDNGVNIHAVDYKKRTPLYLAALYGRNDATMLLLQFGCYAGATDTHDQSCLNIILLKMPHVVRC